MVSCISEIIYFFGGCNILTCYIGLIPLLTMRYLLKYNQEKLILFFMGEGKAVQKRALIPL